MNIRLTGIILMALFACSTLQAQVAKYSKAKVSLLGKDIKAMIRLGIEADHGEYQYGRHLINDFNQSDIAKMRAAGYDVEILIDDVVAYYKDPNRSYDTSIENRSVGCDDAVVDIPEYTIPSNYRYGSMGGYLTYVQLLETLDSMSAKYPNLISYRAPINDVETVGGNKIQYLKISDAVELDEDEPKVLYTALHHAREANSLSQMVFYMWYLLENYETDEYVKYLVDNTQMYFIPCVNPDGYIYNESIEPNGGGLWRKNRNGSGVDLNRNYDFFWAYDDTGSSPNPNNETYRGTAGFSEVETSAVRDLCLAHDFKIALNYHTYGNLLIHPWGYEDGPTEEDDIFKAFGRAMTAENNFLVGTGVETVGYTVNGDSDDWMYGEQDAKERIYSLTPEVGENGDGFWPASNRIDDLNKSCLRQNFEAAHLCGARIIAEDGQEEQYFTEESGTYEVFIRNIGLLDGDITLSIAYNENVDMVTLPMDAVSIASLQSTSSMMTYQLANDLESGEEVEIKIYLEQQGYTDSLVIRKQYVSGTFETLLIDSLDTDIEWTLEDRWGLTTEDFVSAPASLTDSPNAQYSNNSNTMVVLNTSIDLSNAITASLKFHAKWDIEVNYDYAQVMVTKDGGITNTALCGKYTVTGNGDQDTGQPLFHGTSDWVLEEMDLSDFVGESDVQFSVRLVSDGFVRGDGFYIDDFEIEVITDGMTSVEDLWSGQWTISPNPADDMIQVNLADDVNASQIRIYDVLGKLVYRSDIDNGQIDISGLTSGLYTVMITNGVLRSTKKLVKQ